MSNNKKLGPKKAAAAERKKMNELIREMADVPEGINYRVISEQYRSRLFQTAQKDLKEMMDKYADLNVDFIQDTESKTLIMKKGMFIIIQYFWDTTNLMNQLVVVKKLKEYYAENKGQILAMETPTSKIYREVTDMIERLPDRYDPENESLNAYLDQFNRMKFEEFRDMRMREDQEKGTLPRVRQRNEPILDYEEFIRKHYESFAMVMYSKSVPLLGEKMKFDKKNRKD